MNREERLAVRGKWTGVLNAVEAAEQGILDQLDTLGELAIAAQRIHDPVGFDLECSVECIRGQLSSLQTQLAALLHSEVGEPSGAEQKSAVLVG